MVASEHGLLQEHGLLRVGGFALAQQTAHCTRHGAYTAFSFRPDIWSGCEHCLREQDQQRRQQERQQQAREHQAALWQQRLGRAALPQRFADKRLDNYQPACQAAQQALATCRDFANRFDDAMRTGRSLILSGGVGTGKTHLATGIAHAVLRSGRQALFSSVSRAIRAIKSTYSKTADMSEGEAIALFVEPDLLILDEVGVQFGSETEKMYLFEIINGRYELLKPTILISNLGLPDLDKYIGTRVMDRLREGGGRAVVFDWPSYRRTQQ